MSEEEMSMIGATITLETSELRRELLEHRYDRAVAIAAYILDQTIRLKELDDTQSQEVAP